MVKENYLITEAAKEVQVETHVLRYWEEELQLTISRNEQGHRIYSKEDINKLIRIKQLKDQGLQLKAVKKIIGQEYSEEDMQEKIRHDNPFAQKQLTKISKNGEIKVVNIKKEDEDRWKGRRMIEIRENATNMKETHNNQTNNDEKILRMQYLLQKYMQNTLETNNKVIIEKISDNIKQDICKELDYQFRLLQEQEDQRLKLEEDHFRKIDELLRTRTNEKKKHVLKAFIKK